MRTRATPDLGAGFAATAALCFALALSACGAVERVSGEEETVVAPPPATPAKIDADAIKEIVSNPEACLLGVWEAQDERDLTTDRTFDRAHDEARGGTISCATGTSPSQFEAAIAALRAAATSADKARILAEVGVPLVYIDRDGERRAIDRPALVDAVFDEVFDGATIAMLGRIDLADMTVVPEQKGGFFELGSLWLVVDEPGGRPRIVTVNRQAIDEAAQAAAAKAKAG